MMIEKITPQTTTKRTLTLKRGNLPLVVDIWEPAHSPANLPILLVHGWGGTGSYWRDVAAALSETNMVIVPDLPGTGRSQPVDAPQDMFAQVETLAFLLDSLELERVQVVGHSMGGAMTLLLAEKMPERIERIVLTSLTFFRNALQEQQYRMAMRVFRVMMRFRPNWLADVPGVANMMAKQYFHQVPDDPAVLREGLLDYLQLDGRTAKACADDATHTAIPRAGANVNVPVLLVAARQDNMMPMENVDHTAGIIPDCTVVYMDDCGHLPMVEKTGEYLAILREFLRL